MPVREGQKKDQIDAGSKYEYSCCFTGSIRKQFLVAKKAVREKGDRIHLSGSVNKKEEILICVCCRNI